jgi:CubicO group peptidase (beta-lactamase class C family)
MYNSFGFVILGAVIEKLTGQFSHRYIEENILKPLRMTDSGFRESMTREQARRSIVSSERREKHLNAIIGGTAGTEDGDELWDKIPSTGGGMFSTPYDLIRFANMTLSGGSLDGVRIIGRKALEKMTAKAIFNVPDRCWGANTPDRGYGVGFDMRQSLAFTCSGETYCHEGSGACAMYIDPREELAAAWFVPFAKEGWFDRALFNVVNIIWSGLK